MSLEQTIDNLQIRNANMVTFVGTSNTMVDTTTGRIQTKGIQHNSNVITDVSGPHGRIGPTLKKYPEIDFAEGKFDITEIVDGSDQYWDGPSTVFQGGYSLKTTQHSTDSGGQFGWMAFDGNSESLWKNAEDYDTSGNYDYGYTNIQQRLTDTNSANHDGDHVIMGSPSALKMAKVTVTCKNSNRRVVNYSVLGSNSSGATGWTLLDSGTFTAQDVNTATISSPTSYFKYHAFVVRSVTAGANGTRFQINSIDFYGYEEDPPAGDHSVDTTFKSRFNNPQTTGVQVLVDGATGVGTNQISGGPDPSGNQSTYDSTGKYWTLNGTLTSNLSVEANTFLEGDQPHAVSVWFNSSNLEANTANTCVFSVSDQEKLDSQNLDLQSNTWHNLTYAYQGEGGSRVTYLDGRKVSEDQAEDTFGDYPPFAMTGYSQGGYVVSSNSENSGNPAWEAFDSIEYGAANGEGWETAAQTYRQSGDFEAISGGSGGSTVDTITDTNSGQHTGYWIKIEFPQRIRIDYARLQAQNSANQPKSYVHLFSNNDQDWDLGYTHTTGDWAQAGIDLRKDVINTTKYYKYAMILVKSIRSTGGTCRLHEIGYYGHRENDLVRLPDPTNVLKYPHITMTEDARRGYVVSASGNHSNGNHPTWKAFDGVITNDWQINGGRYSNSGGVYTHNAGETTVTNVQSRVGDWVQLESPHKIRVKTMKFTPIATYGQERSPATGVLVGSNDDGSTWTEIKVFDVTADGTPTSYTAASPTTLAIDSGSNSTPGYYKIHRLIWLTLYTASQTTYADRASVADLEFYGTGVDSIPIQIGGGNIDKVANFRVYDKFIEEDQVNEIWNAQKEEFGRAKPQMVLQQGKLGIGTDAPQGSLSVADEPHNLEEFPPRAMTDYKTYFEGHGEFCVSASSFVDPSVLNGVWTQNIYPWDAFNKTNTYGWVSTFSVYTNGLADSDSDNRFGILGEWLEIEMPSKIKLKHFTLSLGYDEVNPSGTNTSRFPKVFNLYKSNDGVTWTTAMEITTPTAPAEGAYGTTYTYNINESEYYSRYLIQVKQTHSNTSGYTNPSSHTAIGEWRLFGTREQGQSVLHDGQLTLTKNLDVPRIGPPLDADDTPRRDRLVVEYNTSTNPTFEGAVRDTSGRGFHGALFGGAYYDANEKALVFDGSGDYTEVQLPSHQVKGEWIHSVSCWVKADIINGEEAVWNIGDRTGQPSNQIGSASTLAFNNTSPTLRWYLYNADAHTSNFTVTTGQWYHITCVYTGGVSSATSQTIYVNGVKYAFNIFAGAGGALNFDANRDRILMLGRLPWGTSSDLDGSISNFKLYDCALTAEEVKTLYDMGRNGSVANPQPLHIAAPLYSPGASIQTVAENVHDIVTYSSATSRTITPLTIHIKPKFANSKILLHWMINAEINENNVVVVYRNGVKIGYNTSITDANWVGLASAIYDVDLNSTIENLNISWIDAPGTTENLEYSIVVKSANTASYPVHLNRTNSQSTSGTATTAAGNNSYERTVSFKSATEIAQ